MIVNKVPPSNNELEKVVLGIMLFENSANTDDAIYKLKDSVFYVPIHQVIFRAISRLRMKGSGIDTLLVLAEIDSHESDSRIFKSYPQGTPYYLVTLMNTVVSSANLAQWVKNLIDIAVRRLFIEQSQKVYEIGYDETASFEEINKVREEYELKIEELKFPFRGARYVDLVFNRIEKIMANDGSVQEFIPTKFEKLNEFLDGGFYPTFSIIAARPAMGKTAFMVDLMDGISKLVPVGIVQLETSSDQFIDRHIGNNTSINISKLKRGNLDEDQKALLSDFYEKVSGLEIFSLFESMVNLSTIVYNIKSWARKGCKFVLIDYLQIAESDDEDQKKTREQQVSKIARVFQALAKHLNISIVALAQLSREVTKRSDKRPNLGDLRESGAIEQAARTVIFLHRPEYYTQDVVDEMGRSIKGLTEVIVAKNNEGETGTARLYFQPKIMQFTEDIEEAELNSLDNWQNIASPPGPNWKPVESGARLYIQPPTWQGLQQKGIDKDELPF